MKRPFRIYVDFFNIAVKIIYLYFIDLFKLILIMHFNRLIYLFENLIHFRLVLSELLRRWEVFITYYFYFIIFTLFFKSLDSFSFIFNFYYFLSFFFISFFFISFFLISFFFIIFFFFNNFLLILLIIKYKINFLSIINLTSVHNIIYIYTLIFL